MYHMHRAQYFLKLSIHYTGFTLYAVHVMAYKYTSVYMYVRMYYRIIPNFYGQIHFVICELHKNHYTSLLLYSNLTLKNFKNQAKFYDHRNLKLCIIMTL